MLPEETAKYGESVLKTALEPNQNARNAKITIKIIINVLKYSFFQSSFIFSKLLFLS